MNYREIRNRFRLIPFGKFSTSGRGYPPDNQVFVGRSRERAKLIEALVHQEKFGAFLVSGRRGSGKTSFVDYVLKQYEKSAFQRFIRFSRRDGPQDIFLCFVVIGLVACSLVLSAQALELFVYNAKQVWHTNDPQNFRLAWVHFPIALFAIGALGIMMFANRGFSALASIPPKVPGVAFSSLISIVAVAALTAVFYSKNCYEIFSGYFSEYLSGDTSAKNYQGQRALAGYKVIDGALIAIFAAAALLFIIRGRDLIRHPRLRRTQVQQFAVASWLTLMCGLWTVTWHFGPLPKWMLLNYPIGISSLITLCVVGASSLALANYLVTPIFTLSPNNKNNVPRSLIKRAGYRTFIEIVLFIFVFFVMSKILQITLIEDKISIVSISFIWTISITTIFLSCLNDLINHMKRNEKTSTDRNYNIKLHIFSFIFDIINIIVIYTLIYFEEGLKYKNCALFSIMGFIILTALIKAILVLVRHFIPKLLKKSKKGPTIKYIRPPDKTLVSFKSILIFSYAICIWYYIFNIFFEDEFIPNYMLIDDLDAVLFSISIFSYFIFEYCWISRPLHREREDFPSVALGRSEHGPQFGEFWSHRSDEPTKRSMTGRRIMDEREVDWWDTRDNNPLFSKRSRTSTPWQRRREITELLDQATFSRLFYEVRVPIISCWINLGFDDLRHSRIVEAMLVQLRDRYRKTLISPFSVVGGAMTFISLFALLVATNLVASNLFGLQPSSTYNSDGDNLLVKRSGKLGSPTELDYCGYFRQRSSSAPYINAIICALPWSNSLYELAYSPVLKLDVQSATTAQTSDDPAIISPDANRKFISWTASSKTPTKKGSKGTELDRLLYTFLLDMNLGLPSIDPESKFAQNSPEVIAGTHVGTPTVRIYHLVVALFVYLSLRMLNTAVGFFPYQQRFMEMTRLIQLIRGRVTHTSADAPKVGWLRTLLGLRKVDESIETTPDVRIIEQSFIDLLMRINPVQLDQRQGMFGWREVRPELVFVFDEMDKLSGKVDPETSRSDEAAVATEENTRERQRAMQLHQLLSDMKRLLSSNAARFIFIGGRLYHDEWLADQVDRMPLLTSTFSGQIYLPSLLTDREHNYGRFNDRIAEYFALLFRNSKGRMVHWNLRRISLPFTAPQGVDEPTYLQGVLPHSGHPRRLSNFAHYLKMRVLDESGDNYSFSRSALAKPHPHRIALSSGEKETLEQVLNFITYRSAGNPKKMKELIESMMEPASKALRLPKRNLEEQRDVRWNKLEDHHDVILLDDIALYRVQFVDVLYRHLAEHLESRMLKRDDKVAMSIFYLMDFLLKFHNRGFSWTNLQRVDELSHIHRAPDLRSMMGVLVDVSSERFLHRILNGVYAFRFRSDYAREIDYLSRISKEEMAALNFTLDESQSLKGLYHNTIRRGDHENVDTISGLGELYEYDQDFEIARNYYRRAKAVLDLSYRAAIADKLEPGGSKKYTIQESSEAFRPHTEINGDGPSGNQYSPLGLILSDPDTPESRMAIRSNFSWAIARLRLMLQIGHTYEQERNFERALGTYMHAEQFSQAILGATEEEEQELTFPVANAITPGSYAILIQAGMATAWIYEKSNQDPDDSIAHAELAIDQLYKHTPALMRQNLNVLSQKEVQHAVRKGKFSGRLLVGDLHDRVGDLYFYKGKQSLELIDDFEAFLIKDSRDEDALRFGYLLKAHYHYAMSIWCIRHYLGLRKRLSRIRLNMLLKLSDADKGWSEIDPLKSDGPVPDVINNSLANSFTNMSEAILARNSLAEYLALMDGQAGTYTAQQMREEISNYLKGMRRCTKRFMRRLAETPDHNLKQQDRLENTQLFMVRRAGEDQGVIKVFDEELSGASALNWLGDGSEWPENIEDHFLKPNIKFSQISDSRVRLNASLFFSSIAAKTYSIAGYEMDAANEYLLQAQTLIGLLWNMRQLEWLGCNGTRITQDHVRSILFPERRPDTPVRFRHDPRWSEFLNDTKNKEFKTDTWDKPECKDCRADTECPQCQNEGPISKERDELAWSEYLNANPDIKKQQALEKSWSDFKAWQNDPTKHFEKASLVLGGMAFAALQQAAKSIEFSHRPSSTRKAENMGDPAKLRRDLCNSARELLEKYLLSRNPEESIPEVRKSVTDLKDETLWNLIDGCSTIYGIVKVVKLGYSNDKELADHEEKAFNHEVKRLWKRRKEVELFENTNAEPDELPEPDPEYYYHSSQSWKDEPRLLTFAAQLVLALSRLNDDKQQVNLLAGIVYDDFLSKYGSDLYDKRPRVKRNRPLQTNDIQHIFDGLYRQTEKFRFPILNRLRSLRILCDSAILFGSDIFPGSASDSQDDSLQREIAHATFVGRMCRELSITADLYDSENHFSPHLMGITYGLAHQYCVLNGHRVLLDLGAGDEWEDERITNFLSHTNDRSWREAPSLSSVIITRESLGEAAIDLLRRSEQMFSMGKAYYENIQNMQYFNDDFNDRIVHYNHAARMFNSEYIAVFRSLTINQQNSESHQSPL